jgi:hypothetical protein
VFWVQGKKKIVTKVSENNENNLATLIAAEVACVQANHISQLRRERERERDRERGREREGEKERERRREREREGERERGNNLYDGEIE